MAHIFSRAGCDVFVVVAHDVDHGIGAEGSRAIAELDKGRFHRPTTRHHVGLTKGVGLLVGDKVPEGFCNWWTDLITKEKGDVTSHFIPEFCVSKGFGDAEGKCDVSRMSAVSCSRHNQCHNQRRNSHQRLPRSFGRSLESWHGAYGKASTDEHPLDSSPLP